MEYKAWSLEQATDYLINHKLVEKGGLGGLIGLDKEGNITMPFNTLGMFRGYVKPGKIEIGIFKNDNN